MDQDALGKQATCVLTLGDVRVYEKQLEDGGHALGFFNLGTAPVDLQFSQLAQIGITTTQHVRDLWRQKNLRDVEPDNGIFPVSIPAHGVALYKLTAAK